MIEFTFWTQSNWYELGTLLTEVAFLAAGIWFARNILRTIRIFQDQVGALLRLSITATPNELHSESTPAGHSLAEASPYWLMPSKTETVSAPEPTESGPPFWRRLVLWLQAPMSTSEIGPWRRVINWLQAPVGN
jgi:hypothetical protein